MAQVKLKSIKRFGARYGSTPKKRFAKLEEQQRKLHKCPYCSRVQVKRVSTGIWNCRKCNTKFTGKAYTISKKKKVIEEVNQFAEEEEKEDES